MFDSNVVEEQKPRLWIWFSCGAAVYVFIVLNVLLSLVVGHISNVAATVLAPGLMLLLSTHVDPFVGFVGGVLLTLAIAGLFGSLGVALRRSLSLFGILQ